MKTQGNGVMLGELQRDLAHSYDQIAKEYNEPSHETLRNFELMTLSFLERNLFDHVKPREIVLDLGGGRCYV